MSKKSIVTKEHVRIYWQVLGEKIAFMYIFSTLRWVYRVYKLKRNRFRKNNIVCLFFLSRFAKNCSVSVEYSMSDDANRGVMIHYSHWVIPNVVITPLGLMPCAD